MNFRTDLAIERQEILSENGCGGVSVHKWKDGKVYLSRIDVETDKASEELKKPKGRYITAHLPPFSSDSELFDGRIETLSKEIENLLPKDGAVLVVGLGNENITPDALGPCTISHILATRHIPDELSTDLGLGKLRPVAAISPGVLGQTGIETGEIVQGIADRIKPSAVITVDALASRRLSRLGTTVQICNTGISPGSGVGNKRQRLDEKTLGVKVISIGVPTVVDGATLAYDLADKEKTKSISFLPESENMMVTPKEIDLLIEHASKLVGMAINCALQKTLTPKEILSLVS
ncbi:MAG: GPR endopeptidase [Clostridia bacterium]|nr:GPR endopeptidase [Clostridia bacterium]